MSRLPDEYFHAMYARDPDPWGLASRWYERRKYALTAASLPAQRYRSAFEPGCSIGVLTRLLAERCDRLLATDVAEAALAQASARTADLPHVTVERRAVPDDWPSGTFDLVVLSEVGYYQRPPGLDRLLRRAVAALRTGGHLLAVHWRPFVADYPLTGDQVHAALADRAELGGLVRHVEERFVLEVFERSGS
ncbi:SAM-dependent methyltransferase [soil metagenome]